MAEDTSTAPPSVLLAARVHPDEKAEIMAALAAFRRRTGRRLTISDVMREGTLAHVRSLVDPEQKMAA